MTFLWLMAHLSEDIMHTPETSRRLRPLQRHNAIAQIDVGQVEGLSDRTFHPNIHL
jgi:hypothetical protein